MSTATPTRQDIKVSDPRIIGRQLPPLINRPLITVLNPLAAQNLPHYTGTPVIIHAPDNRSFVKFGLRRPGE